LSVSIFFGELDHILKRVLAHPLRLSDDELQKVRKHAFDKYEEALLQHSVQRKRSWTKFSADAFCGGASAAYEVAKPIAPLKPSPMTLLGLVPHDAELKALHLQWGTSWQVGAEAADIVAYFIGEHPSLAPITYEQARFSAGLFAKRIGMAFEGISTRIAHTLSEESCLAVARLLTHIEVTGSLPKLLVKIHPIDKRLVGARPNSMVPFLCRLLGRIIRPIVAKWEQDTLPAAFVM
jgi:hypothetical protein